MIFWILMLVAVLSFAGATWALVWCIRNEAQAAPFCLVLYAVACIPSVPMYRAWAGHASDLGTIYAQHEVIEVYQERVNRLTERLDAFNYPRQEAALLLNADSPVASIVASLTAAETQLAQAEAQRAEAIRAIERRRRGPMSGVITLIGDYK